MDKFNAFSYLFFFIAVITQITDIIFSSSNYYYNHFLQLILIVLVISPLIGIILGFFGEKGNYRLGAIALNAVFFVAISLLALLNLWIMTFGK